MRQRQTALKRKALAAMRAAAEVGHFALAADIARENDIWICIICVMRTPSLGSRLEIIWQHMEPHHLAVCSLCVWRAQFREQFRELSPGVAAQLFLPVPAWLRSKYRRTQDIRTRIESEFKNEDD